MPTVIDHEEDQFDPTMPQFRADSAAATVTATEPRNDAAPGEVDAHRPHLQHNVSLDSGIDTDGQASNEATRDGSTENDVAYANPTSQNSADPHSLAQAQLAEEQELTPDVRRIPLRPRRRRAGVTEHRYDLMF